MPTHDQSSDNDPARSRIAYADESFHESDDDKGFYVLAAVTFDAAAGEEAIAAMIKLRGPRRTDKMHWNVMDRRERLAVARRVAAIEGLHLVAIGAPLLVRRQERGRALCLTAMIRELHGYGIEELVMESRDRALNARDVVTARAARRVLPQGAQFRISHHLGAVEPLCWVADVVAGAVRANRSGNPVYRELLAERLYEFNVQC